MQIDDDWLLTAARAAIHLSTATAVVSDLHLGYGEARRRGGEAVPVPKVAAVLAPLRPALLKHSVRRLVIAGDLFEVSATRELADELLAWLAELSVELAAVVPGNHDRGIARAADGLPLFPAGYQLGKYRIVHGDAELPHGYVMQGHEHPCLRWPPRRRAFGKKGVRPLESGGQTPFFPNALSAPCYLVGARRLILPAYSADAAGVSVLHQARWRAFRCGVIVGEDVLDFGLVADLPSRLSQLT